MDANKQTVASAVADWLCGEAAAASNKGDSALSESLIAASKSVEVAYKLGPGETRWGAFPRVLFHSLCGVSLSIPLFELLSESRPVLFPAFVRALLHVDVLVFVRALLSPGVGDSIDSKMRCRCSSASMTSLQQNPTRLPPHRHRIRPIQHCAKQRKKSRTKGMS